MRLDNIPACASVCVCRLNESYYKYVLVNVLLYMAENTKSLSYCGTIRHKINRYMQNAYCRCAIEYYGMVLYIYNTYSQVVYTLCSGYLNETNDGRTIMMVNSAMVAMIFARYAFGIGEIRLKALIFCPTESNGSVEQKSMGIQMEKWKHKAQKLLISRWYI